MPNSFFAKHAKTILIVLLLSIPVLFFGAARAVRSNNNQVEDWLPSTFGETRDLAWFREHFAADQFVIISWDGCCLGDHDAEGIDSRDDPRIEKLARMLVPELETAAEPAFPFPAEPIEAPANRYFKTVTTGRRVLDALTAAPSNLPYEQAVNRLKGALIGPDGHQTCVVVTLTPLAVKNLREAIGRGSGPAWLRFSRPPGELYQAIAKCHIDLDSVHLGGPPVDNVAIDEEGEKTLMRLAGLSMFLGLGLAWWSLRSVVLTGIVFGCGILSAMLAMAFVYYLGFKMDAILMSMPLLVYVLAMSGAVHVVSYYRDELRHGNWRNAAGRAVRTAWKPALLCSVTTAVGLASLYASELAPIRKFGLFSALGVMGLLAITFLYLPAALQLFHAPSTNKPASDAPLPPLKNTAAIPALRERKRRLAKLQRADRQAQAPVRAHAKTWGDRWASYAALFLIRHHASVAIISVALILGVGLGVMKIHTSVDLLKLFEPKSRILADYQWLEKHLGPLVPLEIVVRFPRSQQEEAAVSDRPLELDGIALMGPDELAQVKAKRQSRLTSTLSFLERAELVALCEEMIQRKHGVKGDELVGKSMSPVTFTAPLPDGKNDAMSVAMRSATSDVMWNHRSGFISSGFMHVDPNDQSELWRISLRVKAFAGVDFGHFLDETRSTIRPVLAAHRCRTHILDALKPLPTGGQRGVVVWVPDSGGNLDSLPQTEQFFIRALRYLLTREGVRTKFREIKPGAEQSLDAADFQDLQVTLDKLPAEIQAPLTQHASTIMALSDIDQGRGTHVDPANDREAGEARVAAANVDAIFTGIVPIVYKSQRKLLEGLISSTFWSFITITPLMMFVCRGFLSGSIVMIPNVLPVLFIFGGMGWLKMPVDIGSMMAASIALGVAVDDTIHFLAWYRKNLAKGKGRRRSIMLSYRHCAAPTIQSSLISGLGLSVFMLSTFMPTRRLGLLMLVILLAGCVAELIMLPAILAGPLGRVFRSKTTQSAVEADHQGDDELRDKPAEWRIDDAVAVFHAQPKRVRSRSRQTVTLQHKS